ncbi:MAG: glycosyltransferase family 9 protein [Mariprofundaceae bacterium]
MKILIVKLSAFGDIIHALPALDDLLAHPEVEAVHWLVDKRYRFVTQALPEAVQVHDVDMKGDRPLASIVRSVWALRKQRFDVVLDMQGLIKSSLLARLAGPRAYGIDAAYCREQVSSWLTRPVRFHPDERHVVQQYRRVATAPFVRDVNNSPDTPIDYAAPCIKLSDAMRDEGWNTCKSMDLRAGEFVVLHVGGGWQTKQLPDSTWKAIADGVARQGGKPVFSWGSANEADHAASLSSAVKGSLSLTRRLDMTPLCGMLAAARAVIGADTGVIHLAAALNTPTISFWGPSASWRSAPLGPQQFQIESNPDCGPCFKRSCDNFICMENIHANNVLEMLNAC